MFKNLTKLKKLAKAKEMFQNAIDRDYAWQREAREDFLFRDGFQWSADERQILQDELRPVLTFNLTKSSVDLIMGMNEDVRVQHRATPIDPTDGFLADVLNDIIAWVAENNEFELEEDGALESAVISGRGWIAIDFVPDPDRFGEIVMTEIDVPVHEVAIDPAARRSNLEDASYITWNKWMTVADFKIRYPKVGKKKLKEMLNDSPYGLSESGFETARDRDYDMPRDDYRDADYDRELDLQYYDKQKNMIRVVHMEYWEVYDRYFAFNPEIGDFVEIPGKPDKEQQQAFFQEFGEPMTFEKIRDKKVKWIQFNGDTILYDDDSPLPFKGFSIVPMFAYRDVSKRTTNHYGIVRLMKDPQKEINKRWSQALNMLNQQVQPGIYAETDAFVDERQAEQSMKEAGAITWVNSGALTGGKLKERTVPNFPNAPMQMEQYSQDIMKKITGINPDLLGQDRGRQEPGVVVRLRQQQGITLLKPLFRNYNSMKKQLFKRQMAIVMEYMPDNQILRILGEGERYTIDEEGTITDQATGMVAQIRDVRNLDYNINAEPSTGNMTKRMIELQAMLEMGEKIPVPPEQIIDKLDISATEKQRWIEYVKSQEQSQMQMAQGQMQQEQANAEREFEQEDTKMQLDFMTDMAKIKQMAEKDEKSQETNFARLNKEEQDSILQFTAQMANVMATVKSSQQKGESNGRTE
jgi:hypothetical protein